MTGDAESHPIDRRTALAVVGSSLVALSGGLYLLRGGSRTDEDPDPIEESDRIESIPSDAESIAEYGAEPNPDDPGIGEAEQNLDAIRDAADAAGDGGSIYVPEGTYFFGHDGSGPSRYVTFGENEPAGVSIHGRDPERSVLAVTSHAPPSEQSNQSGFVWDDNRDHGRIVIQNVALNGNYENLGDLRAAGGGSWGVQLNGRGELHLFNAHIHGWHLAGIRGRDVVRSAQFCTFEDNGIKNHNETAGGSISHHISCNPPDDTEFVAKRCHFIDCAGSAINVRYNDGVVRMHDCYVEGTGANLVKLSAGTLLKLQGVYHEASTESLKRKIDERPDGANFHGRNFIQSLGERGNEPVTVDMQHVETRRIREYALQSRDIYQSGPPAITWTGDMIAIRESNMVSDNEVIRNRSGGTFVDVEINRLSVHDSGARVFETNDSEGVIHTLHREGNAGGLGETGQIEIKSDRRGEPCFRPNVPSRNEVGINAFGRRDQ